MARRKRSGGLRGTPAEHERTAKKKLAQAEDFAHFAEKRGNPEVKCGMALEAFGAAREAVAEALWTNDKKLIDRAADVSDAMKHLSKQRCGRG